MRVSIGICAYNEEANIGNLLKKLIKEPLLNEIIVIADGCTDNTIKFTKEYILLSDKVKLLTKPERSGKSDAVNRFIKKAQGEILILESADTIPTNFCFKYLLKPFNDSSIGMVGAHPIPVNNNTTLTGRIAHLLWEVHHQSALIHPKAGEVCAFRNVIDGIDPTTPVDEASIEHEIVKKGLKVVYEPYAIIFNKGPDTISDFMKQRKRIYHGHLALNQQGYSVPTMNYNNLINAVLRATGKHYRTLTVTMCLELLARQQASKSFKINGYKPTVWEMANTTKEIK